RVIASFGSAGLYCFDFTGKELWHRDFGKMNHMFGNAASPMLAGDLCVLNFGPDEKARLIAVNKKTGETAWEVQPPVLDPAELASSRGGPGGGGGGGRGGFGPGNSIGPVMFTLADKNADKKVTAAELAGLADTMFDKLDPEKTGKVSAEQFAERFYDAIPRPDQGSGPGGDAGGSRRGPSRTTAPAFLGAADADKDGSLTRAELKSTFAKWAADWDTDKTDALTEEKLVAGLSAALPRTGFGGGGGGGGGRAGGGGGASWSTPVLIEVDGHPELIMNFPGRLTGLDPKTGRQLWISKGLGGTIYTTPVWGEGVLFATTSGPGGGAAIAVKPGGSGDVTESRRVWRLERAKGSIGSGVIHRGHLFTISQDGIATCLSVQDGRTVWEERLKGTGSRNSSWSSMLLAGDRIYVPNQSGDVFVLRAAPKFEVLATNSVGEPTNASLAASDGEVFLRTDRGLWCFAERRGRP
ncbi:MAG TPA: PQQ-binding-like beta-propeller repeat protein, partial [Methylomirabilota bacterium]|nr:PQQ-binding-like beta-propeller repeat protein [Methylomirabilota bacterium]